MKQETLLERQHAMLSYLAHVPQKILLLHGSHNATEFVLHDLCHERCFNLSKAAFFIDNPDFNCTKGVAGFSRTELPADSDEILQSPDDFGQYMKSSSFNQKVRALSRCSLKSLADSHDGIAQELAVDLGMSHYGYCNWGMKHENYGFVLYEKVDEKDTFADDYLLNGLSLLSFCPIF